MKLLRSFALMIALGVVPFSQMPAFAQQEVDPDHFDQTVSVQKVHKSEDGTSGHGRQHAHTRLASKHHSNKMHHHSSRAVA